MDPGDYLTLSQAARLVPGRLAASTLWRWHRRGVRAASGQRVRLRCVRFGRRLYTTAEWLEEFSRRLAEADGRHYADDATRQVMDHAEADEWLRKEGI